MAGAIVGVVWLILRLSFALLLVWGLRRAVTKGRETRRLLGAWGWRRVGRGLDGRELLRVLLLLLLRRRIGLRRRGSRLRRRWRIWLVLLLLRRWRRRRLMLLLLLGRMRVVLLRGRARLRVVRRWARVVTRRRVLAVRRRSSPVWIHNTQGLEPCVGRLAGTGMSVRREAQSDMAEPR